MTAPVAPGTIAFVPPRYGPGVVGGAEAVLAEAARGLRDRGHPVEILTTCARDHYTWANEFPPGESDDGGVLVRRFPTRTDTGGVHRERIGARILNGERVSLSDQQLWVNDSLRVPDLWHHVLDHGTGYRALVFAPYMFWTTYAVGQIVPGRTILMPCLHDEPTARLDIFRPLMGGARGVWFLTEPEADLARRLLDVPARHAVIGSGIDIPGSYQPDRFRSDTGITRPFVYYAGRREWGKGWSDLLAAYGDLVRQYPVDLLLVTSGVGAVDAPADIADKVIDLGFVSDETRNNAMAAAVAYVQPSVMESFSRTVLEAWCAGTLVVANAQSAVVRWHVERSGAGLVYRSQAELTETLRFVADRPDAAAALARPGRAYVEQHYQWPVVLDRMEATLDAWLPGPTPAGVGASASVTGDGPAQGGDRS
ncbi:MAG: glycosyltransferase family 4 protein [Acidimicrobiales bacterium]